MQDIHMANQFPHENLMGTCLCLTWLKPPDPHIRLSIRWTEVYFASAARNPFKLYTGIPQGNPHFRKGDDPDELDPGKW